VDLILHKLYAIIFIIYSSLQQSEDSETTSEFLDPLSAMAMSDPLSIPTPVTKTVS